jgi:hypothetical protein
MSMLLAAIVLSPLLVLGQSGQSDVADQAIPSPQTIQLAASQLGDSSFAVRQQAMELLWAAGKPAEAALTKALSSDDPEVVYRARTVLEKFKYGIFPDTPKDVLQLIYQFRDGDMNSKRSALRLLQEKRQIGTMMTLVNAESSEELRSTLLREFLADLEKTIPHLLLAGDEAEAERMLRFAVTTDDGMRHLAVFLLLRGRASDEIAQLRQRLAGAADPNDAKLLAYMLRAQGDLAGARAAADRSSSLALRHGIYFELGDWKKLAELNDISPPDDAADDPFGPRKGQADNIERLGFTAAFHRLAGNKQPLQETIDKIKKLAADNPQQAWNCAEALLINDRTDEGIDLLRQANPAGAFDLLRLQQRYREAWQLAGIGPLGGPYDQGFDALIRDVKSETKENQNRIYLAANVARGMYLVGEKEPALRLFSLLGDAVKNDPNDNRVRVVCDAARKTGLMDQAIELAADRLAKPHSSYLLRSLFPKPVGVADVWWTYFRDQHPTESNEDTLRRIHKLLAPKSSKDSADSVASAAEDLADLAGDVDRRAGSLVEAERIKFLQAVGETCLLRGDRALAKTYFEKIATSSAASALQLADLYAEDQQWEQAAHWYQRARLTDSTQLLAMYLEGRALEKMERVDEGRKLMNLALLAPLASTSRRNIALGMKERGLADEAVQQWELIARSVPFGDWYANDAALNLGNAISGKEPLQAAAYWERLLLSGLKTSSSFTEIEGYLQLPHLVHKARGRGLLAKGDNDAAVAEIWLSHRSYPGDIKLAEDLVPELEKAGLRSAADELFDKVYASNKQMSEDFPSAAMIHNNLAWLAARCDRRLDEALTHAKLANELSPDNAGYIDTLGEVHFRRGDRELAIQCAQRCLELDPKGQFFREQLERFQK